ncbi:MAG: hypothetical protein QXG39_07315 [Candidatus Aenigmatarchaeota archaeon]
MWTETEIRNIIETTIQLYNSNENPEGTVICKSFDGSESVYRVKLYLIDFLLKDLNYSDIAWITSIPGENKLAIVFCSRASPELEMAPVLIWIGKKGAKLVEETVVKDNLKVISDKLKNNDSWH